MRIFKIAQTVFQIFGLHFKIAQYGHTEDCIRISTLQLEMHHRRRRRRRRC